MPGENTPALPPSAPDKDQGMVRILELLARGEWLAHAASGRYDKEGRGIRAPCYSARLKRGGVYCRDTALCGALFSECSAAGGEGVRSKVWQVK